MNTILYLTDLYYPAKGRNYYEEDLWLTGRLQPHFNILIGHPRQALAHLDCAGCIVFRNTGPVMGYQDDFRQFLSAVADKGIPTFNSFDGRGDTRGKQYLVELTREGYPVIPTVDRPDDIGRLNNPEKYVVKIRNGADSIGMEVLTPEALPQADLNEKLIQPFLDFQYEVSFYYLNNRFQYALYAPDKEKRWALAPYALQPGDLAFADKFIRWNNMRRGITRVDACRLKDGTLLLVELEDLNPFLSLDLLDAEGREGFVRQFIAALQEMEQERYQFRG